jgi:hypothetical protein
MSKDARTTPRALRVPVLLLLLALSGYNVWCWRNALSQGEPSLVRWFATWQMFTLLDKRHSELFADAQIGGEWQPIELEALFPTRWESGPRYARSSFWQSSARLRVLAAATCGRHPGNPSRVRFRVDRWGKTLGTVEQPKRKVETKELLDWPCDREVELPKGKPV